MSGFFRGCQRFALQLETWSFIWVNMAEYFTRKVVTILVVGPRRITFVRYATIVETLGAETHSCQGLG